MNPISRQSPLLAGFFLLSLLLHLILFYLLPQRDLFTVSPPPEPVFVEIRPPELPKPLERELDLPVPEKPDTPRETPAKRLGPRDQVVEKETAPKGRDFEDMAPVRPAPPPPKPVAEPKYQPQEKTPPPAAEISAPEGPSPDRTPEPLEELTKERPKELPKLETLTQLAPQTIARLEDQWRQKYRKDVEEGNAVWLDTEKDILISFFKRFRDYVYGVWNYPPRSAERGEEGTCLLKITVNRDGTLKKVQLMESSRYKALDDQAIEAVKKAAPFGPLPRAYTPEELNIFAFFQYNLSRTIVY